MSISLAVVGAQQGGGSPVGLLLGLPRTRPQPPQVCRHWIDGVSWKEASVDSAKEAGSSLDTLLRGLLGFN